MIRINTLSKGKVDEKGNKLIMRTDGKIILRLVSGDVRNIGKVKKDKNGYYIETRRAPEHYMEKAHGWGFNYELIKILPEETRIVVISGTLKYMITAGMILKGGKFLYFLQQGFERQLFIEKSMFGLY